MTEQKDVSQYFGNLLFPNIFKLFRIAIQPGRIMTAFLALAIIFIAGWIMDFSKTVVVSSRVTQRQLRSSAMTGSISWPTELHCFVNSPERTDDFIKMYKDRGAKAGVFQVWSSFCMGRFNTAAVSLAILRFDNFITSVTECIAACVWVIKYHIVYGIILFFISLLAFSVTGGAICRGAALSFSKDESAGITKCIKFSLKKFLSFFFSPLAPVILVASLGLFFLLLGLIANIPWVGEIIMAVGLIFLLFIGMIMTFTIIGAVAGANLMFGAIAYEAMDTFDAISRSFNYVRFRPWRLAFYSFLAAIYGAICYLFVRFCAFVLLAMSRWFLTFTMWKTASKAVQFNELEVLWPKPEFFNLLGNGLDVSKSSTESIAAFILYFIVLVIAGLVVSFAVSFYFSSGTVIYCLLRNKADNIPLDSIFIETEQVENKHPENSEQSSVQSGQTQDSQ